MKNQKKNPVRIVWLLIGFLSMGIGAVGVVLPVLPTTPFLLLASFCLAKGSARFHRWFTGTNLYKKHLESFVENRTMTLKTKFSLLIPASCMLILAFLAMQNVYGRVFIIFLILFKYVYFFTRIRTVPAGQNRIPEVEG
ncbi:MULTISPECIES: YbaN family protein [Mediterraneibacter]|uniref:YbaN family protein n=1 Tax=Mediterraneibacter TaxID=2316020 RepID=UPI001E619CA0|nr:MULTISPECIES: YbaN family protein [Mediterraneibacter]